MAKSRPLKRGPLVGGEYEELQPVKAEHVEVDATFGLEDPHGVVVARESNSVNSPIALGGKPAWPVSKLTAKTLPDSTDQVALEEAGGSVRRLALGSLVEGLDLVEVSRAQLAGAGLGGLVEARGLGAHVRTLCATSGRWRAGYQPGADPGDDPNWHTLVAGTYATHTSGGPGTDLAVGQTVTGGTSGATGKVTAVDHTAKTCTVNLSLGTFVTGENWVGPTDTLNTVSLASQYQGVTTGYADPTGLKCPRYLASGPYFNTVQAQWSDLLANAVLGSDQPRCWPTRPEYCNGTFEVPAGLLVDGARLDMFLSGWLTVTAPQSDLPALVVAVMVGGNIFTYTSLSSPAGARATRMTFTSPTLPTMALSTTREPVEVHLWCNTWRTEDRQSVQQWFCRMRFRSAYWGGDGEWSDVQMRGFDLGANQYILPAHDFETADQLVAVQFTTTPMLPTTGTGNWVDFRGFKAQLSTRTEQAF